MARGVPNDPVAYAAKRAAIYEAKRVAKLAAGPIELPPVKRTYKPRKKAGDNQPPSGVSISETRRKAMNARKGARIERFAASRPRMATEKADLLTETHAVEPKILDLENTVDTLTWENEALKKRVEDSDRRIMTLLDLISKAGLV